MRRHGTHLFTLAGFRVGMDLSWLIIAFLVMWTLASGVFPGQYPGLSSSTYWFMGIACAAGLLMSIVLHELSHSLVARRFGMPIGGITLFVFGGIAQMEQQPPSPGAEARMAIAGPLASVLIGGVLYGLHSLAGSSMPVPLAGVVRYLGLINLVLAGFNLVPAFPLDGGRLLRAALWKAKHSVRRATRISSNVGRYFGYLLIGLGMLALLAGNLITGIWWGLIGLFIAGAARSSYRQLLLRRELEGEPVSRFMEDSPLTVPADTTVEELLRDYVYRHYKKMFPVTDRDGGLVGCVSTEEIKHVPEDQRGMKTAGQIALRCNEETTIAPDEDATKALARMKSGQRSRLVVAENGRPVGVITLKDLLWLLAMKVDLEE